MSESLFFSPKRKRISGSDSEDSVIASISSTGVLLPTTNHKLPSSRLGRDGGEMLKDDVDHSLESIRARTRRKSVNELKSISPSVKECSFDIKTKNLNHFSNEKQDENCGLNEEMEMDENISRLLSNSSDNETAHPHRNSLQKEEQNHAWLTEDVNNFTKSCDIFEDDYHNHQNSVHNRLMNLESKVGIKLNYSAEKITFGKTSSPNFHLDDTPVRHVGSPSVFDCIEYPIGNDDSIEVSPKKFIPTQVDCDSMNHSIDQGSSHNASENRSPSGVHYVSDLSNNHLKLSKAKRKTGIVLPLPDIAAFDSSKSKIDIEKTSPICPPTPLRTPLWHSSLLGMTPEQVDWPPLFQNHDALISIPLIMRQNSLEDNKLLLSQSESPKGDVLFLRDFVIEGLIGSGAFAEVYSVKTRHDIEGQRFAVKKIKRQFRSRKDRDWLLNEVKVMKKLGRVCNYIVQFVRAWQEDSYFYVQLGLASKGSLRDLQNTLMASQRIFPDYTIWHILHDAACGLHHIHSTGFVHLDIKPANLLIHQDGYIQIGDFGMASEIGSQEDGHEGDTRYMAPELLNFSERMCSADIFSLGLTILEISYSTENLLENNISLPTEGLPWQHLRSGRINIPQIRSVELRRAITGMLAPEANTRPTAFELIQTVPNSNSNYLDDQIILEAQTQTTRSSTFFSGSFYPITEADKNIDSHALAIDRAITPF